MRTENVDVVVIGLGPGGEDVAAQLARAGLRVVGVERELVGGECPYWGCVPSKMIIRAADLLAEARRIPGVAGRVTVDPDFTPVAERIRREATDDWDDRVAVERFEQAGGIFVRGSARLDGPGRAVVGDTTYVAARGVVLATGTSPAIPPIPGLAEAGYWTNRDAISTKEVPASLIVLGGGAIGLELAQAFGRFGARITVVEGLPRLLPLEEPEAGELITGVLVAEGHSVHAGVTATAVRREGEVVTAELSDGRTVAAEQILVATGRRPNVRGVGLDTVGLDENGRPAFTVDAQMRVQGAERLWAVGDVAGKGAFTHLAVYQAAIATASILGQPHAPAQYHGLSRVTFTDPEIGSVGLTEQAARDQGLNVRTGIASVPKSSRGWIHGPGNEGFIKLVEDADRGVLVGATSAGPRGGEVLSMLNLAVHAEVPTEKLRTMIYAYPTFYRGTLDALADLK